MPLWFKYKCTVIFPIIFSIIDVALSTVLYGHGVDYLHRFLTDFYNFDIYRSVVEWWVFSVTRFSLLIGVTIGFARNPAVARTRVACIKPFVTAVLVTMWVYINSKLLLYVEVEFDLRKPWFWSFFGWSNFSVFVVYFILAHISELKVPAATNEDRLIVTINDDEESRVLVNSEEQPSSSQEDNRHSKRKDGEDEKEKKTSSAKTIGRLLKLSFPDWYILLTAFIFMTVSSGAEVFIPYYTGAVIQGIVIDKSSSAFSRAIIIMGVLSMSSSIAAGIRGGCFKLSMARFQVRVCNHLFSALMQQEVGFYDVTRTGEITSRLTSDVTTMCEALSLNTNIFLRCMIQVVGVCVFMLRLSWKLTMVSVIGLPLLLGISEIYGEFYKNLSKKVQDSLAIVNEVAEEACSSIRTVRSFANELTETGRYAEKLQVTFKLKVKESVAYAGYMWCSDFFALGLVVATLYYGGHLVILHELSGGNLVSFILYQMQLGYLLESMASVYTGLMQAVGASEKVFELLDREPEIHHEEGKLAPEKLEGMLEFQDVCFTYKSRPDNAVLQNVSFTVSPGEVVALVGPSGGGKSTIVSLLEHFYEPESGQVLLDGTPIQEYDHKYLHTKVALVGQEPVLYARSVKENIAYGMDTFTEEEVEKAAVQANAHGFITDMKEKYETQTGEKGMQLSGGQKQRVAIARALIRNPVVLLLDEATSALDSESEHTVQEAIYNNLKGRTVIIVAHRLSTVERANRIIVINKGKVEEQGTHTELLQRGGMYASLVKRQLLAFDSPSTSGSNAQGQ